MIVVSLVTEILTSISVVSMELWLICSYFLMFLEDVICDILFTCLIRTRVGDCLYEHMHMWSRIYAMQYHRRLSRFILVTTNLQE